MQCPRCGAILPKDSIDCNSCGAHLTEVMPPGSSAVNGESSGLPTVQISGQQENAPVVSQLGGNEAPALKVPSPPESGWTEFSGVQAPVVMPTNAAVTNSPLS